MLKVYNETKPLVSQSLTVVTVVKQAELYRCHDWVSVAHGNGLQIKMAADTWLLILIPRTS